MICDRCGWEAIGGWYRWDGSIVCLSCINAALAGRRLPEEQDRLPIITTLGELLRRLGGK